MRLSRPSRSELGISSAVMLATLLPLLVVAGTMLSIESTQMRETESTEARLRARSIAAGGAHDAIARLLVDPALTGSFTVDLDAGTAAVAVIDAAIDGEDNDRNGRVDDATEADLVAIRSEGFLGFELDGNGAVVADHGRNWRGRTEVLLRRTRLDTAFDSALYFDDPFADLRFSGNAFLLSGYDMDLKGNVDRRDPHPAIGTPGDPKTIKSRFPKSQRGNVIGDGGLPSVKELEALDLETLIETFGPLATLRFKDGEKAGKEIGDRKALEPVIAFADGNLEISGRTTGCGLLLVEGDLEINGAFDFVGVIVVGGKLEIRGGGSRTLLGSLLSGAKVDVASDLRGSITVQYSSAAVDLVRQVAQGFAIVSWKQE